MNSLKKFEKRMSLGGNSTVDRLVNQSQRVAENKFRTSPSFHIIDVDGDQVESIVNRTNDYNIKLVHFKHDYDVKIGSIITFDNKKYLLLEKDRDVMYSFAKMEVCNGFFDLHTGKTEVVQEGVDGAGRPVYIERPVTFLEPCVIRDKYYSVNENAPLPLAEGQLDILMKYQKAPNVKTNEDFELYGNTYKIADVSYVDVQDGVGVMRIHAERRDENK